MKKRTKTDTKVVFVVGSPRSGTTILENILSYHPLVAEWYEPYYIWRSYFPYGESEVWKWEHLNRDVIQKIRDEFGRYRKLLRKPIVLDKSPGHVFNLEIIDWIFPEAKWIHIFRDGRDVTLSIHKEWNKRAHIVKRRDLMRLIRTTVNMLKRQPFWRYRLKAILFELKTNTASLRPSAYLNKSKWQGHIGWGPRFEGWQAYLNSHPVLDFNAMQWVRSVESVRRSWSVIPQANKIEIRYEDLLDHTRSTLREVFKVLQLEIPADFFSVIPKLYAENYNKWAEEFTLEQQKTIKSPLAPLIHKLGYAAPDDW